jgi:hypothetical protein
MSQLLYDQKDNMGNLVGMMLAHTVQILAGFFLMAEIPRPMNFRFINFYKKQRHFSFFKETVSLV